MRKICTYCGVDLPGDASFCPHCAQSLIEKTQVTYPRLWRKKALYALVSVLVLIVAGLSMSLLHRPKAFESSASVKYSGKEEEYEILASTPGVVPDPTFPDAFLEEYLKALPDPNDADPAATVVDFCPPPTVGIQDLPIIALQSGFEEPTATQQQMIADAVTAELHSEKFAAWQASYVEASGCNPKAPEVTAVLHYRIPDFEGERMDCYLVSISANICYINTEGVSNRQTHYELFVSSDGKRVYDSITLDAANWNNDFSTFEEKVTYLLWLMTAIIDGSYSGHFLNNSESVDQWYTDDLAIINSYI